MHARIIGRGGEGRGEEKKGTCEIKRVTS